MNKNYPLNEVKKVVKTFQKDAKTEGSGSYKYISGTQILSAIKDGKNIFISFSCFLFHTLHFVPMSYYIRNCIR